MQSAQEMTDKPHIIADCDIPFLKGVLEPYADMEYLKGSEISHADALRADALIITPAPAATDACSTGPRSG